jgi:hypothetical protein
MSAHCQMLLLLLLSPFVLRNLAILLLLLVLLLLRLRKHQWLKEGLYVQECMGRVELCQLV